MTRDTHPSTGATEAQVASPVSAAHARVEFEIYAQALRNWIDAANRVPQPKRPFTVLRVCMLISQGDSTVCTVLFRMLHWLAANKAGRLKYGCNVDGIPALVKSASELSEESGLSEDQVRKGLVKLSRMGFWTRCTRKFKGTPTSHHIPHYLAILAAIAAIDNSWPTLHDILAAEEALGNLHAEEVESVTSQDGSCLQAKSSYTLDSHSSPALKPVARTNPAASSYGPCIAVRTTPTEDFLGALEHFTNAASASLSQRQIRRTCDAVRDYLDVVPYGLEKLQEHEFWPKALEWAINETANRYAGAVTKGHKPPREHYILSLAASRLSELDDSLERREAFRMLLDAH